MDTAQCVVVLDTNVLHWVRLFLSYAKGGRCYLYEEEHWSANKNCIKSKMEHKYEWEKLKFGGEALHFMRRNKVELARCSAVEAELFRLETYSHALRTAISNSSICGRWFSHFGNEEVNQWARPQARQSVVESLDETFDELESFGIRVWDLEAAGSADVVRLARGIMALVYMDLMDSVIYANSLVASATHLVTSDGYFKRVANRFRTPSTEGEKQISKELESLVVECDGAELNHQEFPIAKKPQDLAGL